jgi:membrane protein implicated in regulation of membrane protease activity
MGQGSRWIAAGFHLAAGAVLATLMAVVVLGEAAAPLAGWTTAGLAVALVLVTLVLLRPSGRDREHGEGSSEPSVEPTDTRHD